MARAAAATEAGGPRGTPDKRVFLCTRVNLGDRARWRHGRAPVRHRAIVPWCGVDSEASIEGGLDILSSGPIQRRLLPSSEFSLAIPNSARRRPCVPSRCGGITSEELKRGGRLARDTCRCPGGAAAPTLDQCCCHIPPAWSTFSAPVGAHFVFGPSLLRPSPVTSRTRAQAKSRTTAGPMISEHVPVQLPGHEGEGRARAPWRCWLPWCWRGLLCFFE